MASDLENEVIKIADWTFRANVFQLERGKEFHKLEPRAAKLLLYLAKTSGTPVSRSTLMEEVWPDVVVGDEALTNAVNKLRKAFGDNHQHPEFIETIPKMGYRLVAPVEVGLAGEENVSSDSPEEHGLGQRGELENRPRSFSKSRILLWVSALVAVMGIIAVTFIPKPNEPVKLSIAVLPFKNLSKDPKQSYLADGITEDITTDLSRLKSLWVISSAATSMYKNREVSPKDVGDELNVDFVLQGSLRPVGEVLRVSAQLVDARTGFNKWAELYDRPIEQIFAIQNEVSNSIVKEFALDLTDQEEQRLAHVTTDNLFAYDHFQEGQRASRILTKESHEEARSYYRKAIEIDPNYGRAYGALAYSLALAYRRGWVDAPLATLDRALELAKRGVGLDSTIPQTHWTLSYVYMMRQEFENAENAVSNAISVAPSFADGYGLLALINNNLGRPEKAIEFAHEGMRLNPFYTWDYLYNLGRAYYTLGKYSDAINVLEKAVERNENAMPPRLFLAASYIRVGREDDAQWEIEQVQMSNPDETISHTKRTSPITNKKLLEGFLIDLRKAGLPE